MKPRMALIEAGEFLWKSEQPRKTKDDWLYPAKGGRLWIGEGSPAEKNLKVKVWHHRAC